MKQLTGIDAAFLYMETPETPMHVAGLHIYEPPADFSGSFFDHFKEFFLSRMHLAPIFEKKLARTVLELDHPGWVDAGEMDFDYHLKRMTLPSPGSFAQLEQLVAELHSVPLDRRQPLWQVVVVEGLDSGNIAVYSKVHHAAVDGGAGMAIAAALFDIGPAPRKVKPPEPKKPAQRKPTIEERAILGINDVVQNVMRQQLKVMEAIPQVLGTINDLLTPKKGEGGGGLPGIPDVLAPKTPFNVTITSQRSFAARDLSPSPTPNPSPRPPGPRSTTSSWRSAPERCEPICRAARRCRRSRWSLSCRFRCARPAMPTRPTRSSA